MARGLEFIEEIKVAQFWRRQLGELEYLTFDADDLRRWYDALELRGPHEIRAYLQERDSRFPTGRVTGIVGKAPHPPLYVIELWLATHNKVHTRGYWVAFLAFFVLAWFSATNLQGCASLPTASRFDLKPPQTGGQMPSGVSPMPQAPSTLPQSLPAPAQNAARPTGGSASSTTPQ